MPSRKYKEHGICLFWKIRQKKSHNLLVFRECVRILDFLKLNIKYFLHFLWFFYEFGSDLSDLRNQIFQAFSISWKRKSNTFLLTNIHFKLTLFPNLSNCKHEFMGKIRHPIISAPSNSITEVTQSQQCQYSLGGRLGAKIDYIDCLQVLSTSH